MSTTHNPAQTATSTTASFSISTSGSLVTQIHSIERHLVQVLQTVSKALSMISNTHESIDVEEARSAFETECVQLADLIRDIQSRLRSILRHFGETGILDLTNTVSAAPASGSVMMEYGVTTAGVEKDLEVMLNGVELVMDLLKQNPGSKSELKFVNDDMDVDAEIK